MEGVRVDEMHPIGMEIKRDGSGTERMPNAAKSLGGNQELCPNKPPFSIHSGSVAVRPDASPSRFEGPTDCFVAMKSSCPINSHEMHKMG